MKADVELDRAIDQSERLARALIKDFVGLLTATVLTALAIVIAHAVEKLSVDKNLESTMTLLTEYAALELRQMRKAV